MPVILPVRREPEPASAARRVIISMSPGHAFLPPSCNMRAARRPDAAAARSACVQEVREQGAVRESVRSNGQYVGRINRAGRQQLCSHVMRALLINSVQVLHNKSNSKVMCAALTSIKYP